LGVSFSGAIVGIESLTPAFRPSRLQSNHCTFKEMECQLQNLLRQITFWS
jgi:hypothetical protein